MADSCPASTECLVVQDTPCAANKVEHDDDDTAVVNHIAALREEKEMACNQASLEDFEEVQLIDTVSDSIELFKLIYQLLDDHTDMHFLKPVPAEEAGVRDLLRRAIITAEEGMQSVYKTRKLTAMPLTRDEISLPLLELANKMKKGRLEWLRTAKDIA